MIKLRIQIDYEYLIMLNGNKKFKQKHGPPYTSEMLYQNLEAIIKQMLRVWAKENVAIRSISGIKSGKKQSNTSAKFKSDDDNECTRNWTIEFRFNGTLSGGHIQK